jgi:hypothetical protein
MWTKVNDQIIDFNKGSENLSIHMEKLNNASEALLYFLMVKLNH